MKIHREIGLSYHHKPIVYGVNFSHLMVESKEEVLVKEERWPEVTPAAIPPPILPRWRGHPTRTRHPCSFEPQTSDVVHLCLLVLSLT
jgi:hypothetical protein